MTIDRIKTNTKISDPKLPKDVLGSKQFATFVEVLGEGEIEGFPSASSYTKGTENYNLAALKDVYLNKTQILKSSANINKIQDTDYNFKDVEFEPRFGTSSQKYIKAIRSIETEFSVNVPVTYSTSVSRTLTSDIDGVRVTISVPRLQVFEDDGSISGAVTRVTIKITGNDGTVITPIDKDRIKGRTSSSYFRDYKINLSDNIVHPATVTVVRTSEDSTDQKRFDEFNAKLIEILPYTNKMLSLRGGY